MQKNPSTPTSSWAKNPPECPKAQYREKTTPGYTKDHTRTLNAFKHMSLTEAPEIPENLLVRDKKIIGNDEGPTGTWRLETKVLPGAPTLDFLTMIEDIVEQELDCRIPLRQHWSTLKTPSGDSITNESYGLYSINLLTWPQIHAQFHDQSFTSVLENSNL